MTTDKAAERLKIASIRIANYNCPKKGLHFSKQTSASNPKAAKQRNVDCSFDTVTNGLTHCQPKPAAKLD
jgi:hypothetical protein